MGLSAKQITNGFSKIARKKDSLKTIINRSFLLRGMKDKYTELLNDRYEKLYIG